MLARCLLLRQTLLLVLILCDLVLFLLKLSRQLFVARYSSSVAFGLSRRRLVVFLGIFNDDVEVGPHEEECCLDRVLRIRVVLLHEVKQALPGDLVQTLPSVYHLSDRNEVI